MRGERIVRNAEKIYRGVAAPPVRDKTTHPMHSVFMQSAKNLRERLNYSQAQVAEKIGMDTQKYSRLERQFGFCPITLDEAYKISAVLESSVLTMTFSSRLSSWMHDLRETKSEIEKSKEKVETTVEALKTVIDILEGYEKKMVDERKSFQEMPDFDPTDVDKAFDMHCNHSKIQTDKENGTEK